LNYIEPNANSIAAPLFIIGCPRSGTTWPRTIWPELTKLHRGTHIETKQERATKRI
jgi:hypothetical protein